MKKIVFVVLHYLAEEMTIECVDTLITSMADSDYEIIIVDNGSNNDSGKNIKEKYKSINNITVLINESNLGFANGNNLGFQYAKRKNPDYIVIMNNDVLINDNQFLDKINSIYRDTHFYILGPDIIAGKEKNLHQNPYRSKSFSIEDIKLFHRKEVRRIVLFPIQYLIDKLRYKVFAKNINENGNINKTEERMINPVLHGACFIFSALFINQEENAFNKNTFLYLEEDILWHECMKKNYLMIYDPKISVYHLEDVATNMIVASSMKRQWNKDQNLLKSSKVLIELLEQ